MYELFSLALKALYNVTSVNFPDFSVTDLPILLPSNHIGVLSSNISDTLQFPPLFPNPFLPTGKSSLLSSIHPIHVQSPSLLLKHNSILSSPRGIF